MASSCRTTVRARGCPLARNRALLHGRNRLYFLCLAGGRQVDGAIGSFSALEKTILSERVRHAQEQGKFTVLFNSGIRTGSDVIEAVAMSAQGVLGEHDGCLLFER
jgi:FMN-dependent dehydrogenase